MKHLPEDETVFFHEWEMDTNIYLKMKHLPEDETVLLKKVAHPFGYGKYCN
jgi:hypothetical protein